MQCGRGVYTPKAAVSGPRIEVPTEQTEEILRVKCGCGKVVKAPADWAGRKGSCPRCSKDIEMPYPKATSKAMLRVTCDCGKVVKAPLAWAGKTGNCPRCKKDLLMPEPEQTEEHLHEDEDPILEPEGLTDEEFAKMMAQTSANSAEQLLMGDEYEADADDIMGGEDETGSGLANVAPAGGSGIAAFEQVSPELWEAKKRERARRIKYNPSRGIYYWLMGNFASVLSARYAYASVLNNNRGMAAGGAVAVIIICTFVLYWQLFSGGTQAVYAFDDKAGFFYDLNSGNVFMASHYNVPPTLAPSGPTEAGGKAGVKAYMFSCSDCEKRPFIGYLEMFTEAAADAHLKVLTAQARGDVPDDGDIAVAESGRLVSSMDRIVWYNATSAEGQEIIKMGSSRTKCPENAEPHPCEAKLPEFVPPGEG